MKLVVVPGSTTRLRLAEERYVPERTLRPEFGLSSTIANVRRLCQFLGGRRFRQAFEFPVPSLSHRLGVALEYEEPQTRSAFPVAKGR